MSSNIQDERFKCGERFDARRNDLIWREQKAVLTLISQLNRVRVDDLDGVIRPVRTAAACNVFKLKINKLNFK